MTSIEDRPLDHKPASRHIAVPLIKVETDRRLGHEWDEWDGAPLANGGDFAAPARLYFLGTSIGLLLAGVAAFAALFLFAPRLRQLAPWLPSMIGYALIALGVAAFAWLGLLALSFVTGRAFLPERLAERGPMLHTLSLASRAGHLVGLNRDRIEHASVVVYDRLALARERSVTANELLILVPRCLSRTALEGVLEVAQRYGVPAFVATRGQLARRVIRERRPKAVVAVACERDLVSGLRDVAARVPVLGLALTLPSGPCKDTSLDVAKFEEFVRAYVR